MALSLQRVKEIAQKLYDRDVQRDTMYRAMDKMAHNDWSLDNFNLPAWVRPNVSTDPHDALMTSVRVLATVKPKIMYYPIDPSPESHDRANKIEDALQWHLRLSNRRSPNPIVKDIVRSAIQYDEVAAQVVHIPTQNEIAGKKTEDVPWEARGLFNIKVHPPATVHAVRTDDGLAQVFLAKQMDILEVIRTWGERANALKDQYENHDMQYCMYYDFTDADGRRAVWATPMMTLLGQPQNSLSGAIDASTAGSMTIYDETVDMPFMPWVERYGNSNLETLTQYKRHPLLASIYQAGQWDNQNIIESLMLSELISHSAAPRSKTKTHDGMAPAIDYETPGSNVELKVDEDYAVVEPPPIDRYMQEAADRLSARISKSTVARVLQNLDFPTGVAYATINAVMQSATKSLAPFKELAQLALGDIFVQELYWLSHKKQDLVAYRPVDRKNSDQYGAQVQIDHALLEPENCVLEVELTEFVPTDLLQKINAGVLMYTQLHYPLERVYEDLGIEDSDIAQKQWALEQMTLAMIGNATKAITFQETFEEQKKNADLQLQQQAATTAMQQQAQAAQQAQQQQQLAAQQGQGQGGPPGQGNPMGSSAIEQMLQGAGGAQRQAFNRAQTGVPPGQGALTDNLGGQGFNPANGGAPPAMGAPPVPPGGD